MSRLILFGFWNISVHYRVSRLTKLASLVTIDELSYRIWWHISCYCSTIADFLRRQVFKHRWCSDWRVFIDLFTHCKLHRLKKEPCEYILQRLYSTYLLVKMNFQLLCEKRWRFCVFRRTVPIESITLLINGREAFDLLSSDLMVVGRRC